MKIPPPLDFPVWNGSLPPAPRMSSDQYDRFLEETLRRDDPDLRMRYLPVAAEFVLVKEDRPVNNESSGTQR